MVEPLCEVGMCEVLGSSITGKKKNKTSHSSMKRGKKDLPKYIGVEESSVRRSGYFLCKRLRVNPCARYCTHSITMFPLSFQSEIALSTA